MKRIGIRVSLFLLSLLGIQQLISAGRNVNAIAESRQVIEQNDIDPSAMFYTEVEQVEEAEERLKPTLNRASLTGRP